MSLASATASAGVRNVRLTSTGPKISSVTIVLDAGAPVHSVGGMKKPVSGTGAEGCQIAAPSASPASRYPRTRSSWTRSTSAPMSIALSRGCPTRMRSMRSRRRSCTSPSTLSCTSSRDPAQQTCPWLNQTPSTTPSTAASRSALSNTTNGDLPPSSSDRCLPVPAVARRISRPTSVEPVNATFAISGWRTSAAPVEPSPVTMLSTPGGSPVSCATSAKRSAVSGVYSAGLSTTVFPAASAGATFQASMSSGKFQGMIWPATPTGSYPGNSSARSCAQPA